MLAEVVRRRTLWTASRTVAPVTNDRLAIVANFRLAPFAAILALLNVRLFDEIIKQLANASLPCGNGGVYVQGERCCFGAIKTVAMVVALNDSRTIATQVEQLFEHFVHLSGSLVNVGNVMIDYLENDSLCLLPGGVAKFLENVVDDGVAKPLNGNGCRTVGSQNHVKSNGNVGHSLPARIVGRFAASNEKGKNSLFEMGRQLVSSLELETGRAEISRDAVCHSDLLA